MSKVCEVYPSSVKPVNPKFLVSCIIVYPIDIESIQVRLTLYSYIHPIVNKEPMVHVLAVT